MENKFIGCTLPTPKGGTLTIVNDNGLKGNKKRYVCECSICSEDKELWPKGSMLTTLGSIKSNSSPCGCTRNHVYEEWQQEIKIIRECKDRDVIFHGFVGTYENVLTKLYLECTVCGKKWNTTATSSFLTGCGCGCNQAQPQKKDWVGMYRTVDDNKHRIIKEKGKMLWYICECCNRDFELFPSPFKISKSDWTAGKNPCGCASYTRWKDWQYDIKCSRLSETRNDNYTFLGFTGKWKGCDTKVVLSCCQHGIWGSQTIEKYLSHYPRSCPKCSRNNSGNFGYFKDRLGEEDTLYLLKFSTKSECFVKVGRTFEIDRRLSEFNQTPYTVTLMSSYKNTHKNVYEIEHKIHKLLKMYNIITVHSFAGETECFSLDCLGEDILTKYFTL